MKKLNYFIISIFTVFSLFLRAVNIFAANAPGGPGADSV